MQIINLSPTTILEGEVPKEVWSGKKVSYKHLRVFGCRAFVHVPKDERSKLDNKSRQCVYLSYGDEKFGYKLYHPITKKVVRSRDVVFFEDQTIMDFDKEVQVETRSLSLVNFDSDDDDDDDPTKTPNMPWGDTDAEEGNNNDVSIDGVIESDRDEDQSSDGGEGDVLGSQHTKLPPHCSQQVGAHTTLASTRVRIPSSRYSPHEYVLATYEGEPICYQEVIEREDKLEWMNDMEDEINSLEKSNTYVLVDRISNRKVLKNRWVFKLKKEEGKASPRYKACLVVKGYEQKDDIDFEEIFSLVVKITSIRVVLGLVDLYDLEVEQLDVKTAFLHGDLEENVFMEQPEGFVVKGKEHMICKLNKSLYGLKQVPPQWYKKFETFMVAYGFG
ncbi:transmembrane signal receptor [Lithospermum erythrorhizon]|uniref:Transmembrane signal receptor n=1 Tax=Lithospermum erythrorhizon TaxID=34254 RepID=A0AAV3NSL2_LITER